MIRFATFGTHKMAQSHMLDSQNRLFDSQMQISSGKVSRNYAGVAIDSRRLVNLENAVTGVHGYIKNINITESRLQLMENAVVGAFEVAVRFRDLLVNALNVDNASLLTLNQRAEDMLQELTGALPGYRRQGIAYPDRGGTYQYFDQVGVTKAMTKWSGSAPTFDRIPELMRRAFRISHRGRPGVVHVDIPENIFNGAFEIEEGLHDLAFGTVAAVYRFESREHRPLHA